jgi:hypothetical protein
MIAARLCVLMAICVGLLAMAAAPADKDAQARKAKRMREASFVVVQSSYEKLKDSAERNPGTVSVESLHGASRELLLAELRRTTSRAACVKAATDYLEREGFRVLPAEGRPSAGGGEAK